MSDRTGMEHDAVIEAIELAAIEPGGLDRLMAGDTPMSQGVAAHVAGCAACALELAAIDRDSRVIADVVATTPTAALRARTLAAIQERGVERGVVHDPVAPMAKAADEAAGRAATGAPGPATTRLGRRSSVGWVAAIAATVVLSVVATTLFVDGRSQDQLAAQAQAIGSLEWVAAAAMDVAAEPDATSVRLAGTTDPSLAGTILFSPTSTELVVTATGLHEPPAGQEYSCWLDAGSGRVRIGKMFFSGGLAYWVGESEAIAGLTGPATFGVSPVEVGSPAMDAEPVLLGQS